MDWHSFCTKHSFWNYYSICKRPPATPSQARFRQQEAVDCQTGRGSEIQVHTRGGGESFKQRRRIWGIQQQVQDGMNNYLESGYGCGVRYFGQLQEVSIHLSINILESFV